MLFRVVARISLANPLHGFSFRCILFSLRVSEVKEILKNSKKICNLECAKCMMNMIDENKGMKSIDFDNLFDNENEENCIKCKRYTELSNSLQSMIDNL